MPTLRHACLLAATAALVAAWTSELLAARKSRTDRSMYWQVYTDVLNDLGGLSGSTPIR